MNKVDADVSRVQTIQTDERKTVDLCGHQGAGTRCMRERGHDGPHESPTWDRPEPIRWH